ncbi:MULTISPECIES: Sec-independent protein translocase protein TatB [Acinetobacter]|jgi:sec-independent protein translocase protein TatB|uniref:Sec-independent protein translocase protein TatB n=1 Tax=Acinetobacter oleivorans (strain JCM 16667 / KCTC 23045 / DR1) TaxID=436717 RepID=A0AAN0PBA3_ACISD|nr:MULTISPECIES: Sec-independent protein translocase protein TatB [Acinetobacter]ADI92303.1 Sec-independent protein translocase protein [Acinetobacter oleivorans DR1]ESK43535.1 twin arginine-targeting protein translocase TatB [Acinetobacter oleivorans CIP 110421]KKC42997.1 preprotein translocase subunit TatB [Acinetobacter sp. V2]PTV46041.1 twin-arginine translocase subunit TatB [Acinetobacter oleivorans]URM40549.1 Sec-independent protein translocase protein TatB [Acinetobacter sp. AS23]
MLDVGMTELLCFAIIAILVLGPDKLPEAARFAGRWYVRLKRYITNLQNEIDQELRLSEFRKEMQEELNRIEALERKVQQQLEEIQKQTTSDNSEKTEVAETISQSTMYSPVSGHYEVPFLAKFTPLASQSDTLETPPVKLKIAV